MHGQRSIGDAMRAAAQAPSSTSTNGSSATNGLAAPPASLEDALHSLYQRAEIVFAGEVTSVERTGDAIAVTFRVDDGIRSVASGSTYVLREWAGLWADDPARYVVGERWLMLLHAASVSGFASPVEGASGAIHLRGDAMQSTADLRWVAAQIAVVAKAAPVASAFAKALLVDGTNDATVPVVDHSAVDGAVVTGMMHAWQRSEAAR